MSHYAAVSACQTSVICSDFSSLLWPQVHHEVALMKTCLHNEAQAGFCPLKLHFGRTLKLPYRAWIANFNTETYAYSYSFNNPSLISKSHRLFYWNNVSGITNENHTGSFFIQQTD